jgi:hydroxymethylpyrimidine pyrophosphatase-like HAD family hydrolase
LLDAGTLLDSHHVLPPTSPTFTVLRRIRATHPELPIVISTGKQYPATASLRLALDLAPFPACHLNGNVVYAPTGAILHETTLALPVVEQVFAACRDAGVSLFLYDRERVYHVLPFKTFTDAQAESLLRAYGEDVVELAEAEEVMRKVQAGETKVTKMGVCEVEEYIPSKQIALARPHVVLITSRRPKASRDLPALVICPHAGAHLLSRAHSGHG